MSWQRRLKRVGNRLGVWMYRRLDGKFASGRKAVHVLMITTPGRRTGLPRSTCVRFLPTDALRPIDALREGSPSGHQAPLGVSGFAGQTLVVWGTGAGSKTDPDWFRNLRKADVAEVQILANRLTVRSRELHGAERDSVWRDVVLAEAPEVERFARKAGRTIPVAVLTAIEGGS